MGTSRPTRGLRYLPIQIARARALLRAFSSSTRTSAASKNLAQSFAGTARRSFVFAAVMLSSFPRLGLRLERAAVENDGFRQGGQLVEHGVETGRRLVHVGEELRQPGRLQDAADDGGPLVAAVGALARRPA